MRNSNPKLKKNNLLLEEVIISPSKFKKISYEKLEENLKQESKLNKKLLVHSLQRHLSLIKLQEFLFIVTFITAGVLGRILLQGFPSIEPITFFALIAGSLFGWKKGAIAGATSWYLSNFFMFGGQGPWSIVHIANGIIAGFIGGVFLRKPNYIKSIFAITLATIIFEISINVMSGIFFYGLVISFITAIPFTITHILSNIGFSLLLPKVRKEACEKGKFNEREICQKYINKIKKSLGDKNEKS